MSPERILEIVERVEARIYPELENTTNSRRVVYLLDRIDHACFLRAYIWLKARGRRYPASEGLAEKRAGLGVE